MSTSVGSTMEGRRSQSYETRHNMASKGGSGKRHHLDSSPHSRTVVLEARQAWMIKQFHGMLKDAVKEELRDIGPGKDYLPGLEAALAMYEGYFGYFGEK